MPFRAVYAASKGALRAYTLALRGELAAHGVAVVLLEPGDIATRIGPVRGAAGGALLYAAAEATVKRARARKMAASPPPEAVAARVLAVLGARRPPPIVACGGTAPLLRFARRPLPDRAAEALTLRSYGLGSRGRPRNTPGLTTPLDATRLYCIGCGLVSSRRLCIMRLRRLDRRMHQLHSPEASTRVD